MNPVIDAEGTCSSCGWPIEHYAGEPESMWHHAWERLRREREAAARAGKRHIESGRS